MIYKQKKSNNYSYKFKWNGRLVRKSTKQKNKRTAEQLEAAHRTALAKDEVGIEEYKAAPTLREFACRFERFIETECASKPQTIKFYKAKLRALLRGKLASKRLDAIQEEEIQDYVEARRGAITRRGSVLSPASVNRELATLRRILRLASRWRLIRRLPTIALLRGERQCESVFSHRQESLFLEAASEPLRSIAIVAVDTGLRMRELLTLDWADVRLEPPSGARFGHLTVRSRNSKNSKSRSVPITGRVARVLSEFEHGQRGLVFFRHDGSELCQTYLNQQASKIRKALDLPHDLTPHAFRHTFGTRLGEAGADAFTIMRLMGHSSVTVSQRYVHPTPESVERAFARFEALGIHSMNSGGILLGIPSGDVLGRA